MHQNAAILVDVSYKSALVSNTAGAYIQKDPWYANYSGLSTKIRLRTLPFGFSSPIFQAIRLYFLHAAFPHVLKSFWFTWFAYFCCKLWRPNLCRFAANISRDKSKKCEIFKDPESFSSSTDCPYEIIQSPHGVCFAVFLLPPWNWICKHWRRGFLTIKLFFKLGFFNVLCVLLALSHHLRVTVTKLGLRTIWKENSWTETTSAEKYLSFIAFGMSSLLRLSNEKTQHCKALSMTQFKSYSYFGQFVSWFGFNAHLYQTVIAGSYNSQCG